MPAQARAEVPATVSVVVTNAHNCLQGRRKKLIFGGAERLLQELLEKKGVFGEYRLMAIAAVKGTSALKGIHFSHAEMGTGRIKLTIQPRSNDTSWAYWLLPPRGESATALFELLTEDDKLPQAAETNDSNVVTLPVPTVEEPAKVKTDPVHDFLEDMVQVALVLDGLFPKCTSVPLREEVVDVLQTHFDGREDYARQAVQGLINRGCLKEVALQNGPHLQVVGEELCKHLTDLGGRQKPLAVVSEHPPPLKPEKQLVREQLSGARPGSRVQLHPVEKTRVPAPKAVAPAPAKKPEFDRAEALANLAKKAQMFAEAQKALASVDPAMTALKERRQRLTTELAQVDADMAALEAGKASAIAVLADPAYSQAAVRMGQIDSLIGH